MKLTIVYITFRLHPRFEWFAASLAREFRSMPDVDSKAIQIVVIDGRLWYDEHRPQELLDAARGHIRFEHHPPKPSAWQGPYRQTNRNYFCAAAVRNTGLAYARGEHVIFVDDLSVLLPGWLKAHVYAATHKFVLAGTTCKQRNIVVSDDGQIVSYEVFNPGQDSRIPLIQSDFQVCSGQWLFGGTFSVPMWAALATNGQDEIYDTIGGEDYDWGMRLERAGTQIQISRSCGTFELETAHHDEVAMVRWDKPWPGQDGPYSSNFLLNRLRRETARTTTIGNTYSLRDMRRDVLEGDGRFPDVPTEPLRHWVDGKLLSEM